MPAAPLVLANLLRPLLLVLERGDERARHTARSSPAACSIDEADSVSAAFQEHGYRERTPPERGEWAALLLEAPDHG